MILFIPGIRQNTYKRPDAEVKHTFGQKILCVTQKKNGGREYAGQLTFHICCKETPIELRDLKLTLVNEYNIGLTRSIIEVL